MRTLLTYLFVLCVLFMTTDSAADIAIEGHPHENTVHANEVLDSQTGTEHLDPDHCESCCHGHFAGLIYRLVPNSIAISGSEYFPDPQDHAQNLNLAPPTPPPNA